MTEYKDNISKARAQLEEAQTNLVEAYLTRIREGYQTLEPRQKEFVLGGLDALVNDIENGSFTDVSGISSASHSTRKNLAYDPERAKEIRKQVGYSSQRQLAEELGLGASGLASINKYEAGKVKPSNPPRGKTSIAYINWLKEQGYNPFEL